MDDKIKGLFPITQAAAACGLSRSTLMRMEEKMSLFQRNVEELRIRAAISPDQTWQGSEGARACPCSMAACTRYRGSLYRTGDRSGEILFEACDADSGELGFVAENGQST